MQTTQYWVVGGEYTSIDFKILIGGTERVVGPFDDRQEAERTWRTLSESFRPQAQIRFTIAQETLATAKA